MRMILLGAMAVVLSGCAAIPQLIGSSTVIYSSPKAGAMRACADGLDVFTPGISPQAIPGLLRGSAATLGSTPEEAMENCLKMLGAIPN